MQRTIFSFIKLSDSKYIEFSSKHEGADHGNAYGLEIKGEREVGGNKHRCFKTPIYSFLETCQCLSQLEFWRIADEFSMKH
jgi:hypothetical protein